MMAQRHLVIEQSPGQRRQMPSRVQVSVDDRAAIGPWMTKLAASLGYPLVDTFGSPLAYRLRSVSDETILPTVGQFADARFSSGSRFFLELERHGTVSMRGYGREANSRLSRPLSVHRISRRSLMSAGLLTTFSLLGFGSGMTTAFAQHLLAQRVATTALISRGTTFLHHRQPVRTVTWAPDESMLASGSNDGATFLWNKDGHVFRTLQFTAPVRALAWSPDGVQLAAGSANSISFFAVQTGTHLAENGEQHTALVTSLGWTNTPGSAPLAISASRDKKAIVWNGQSHQPLRAFRQHTSSIEALTVLPNTVTIATASLGGVIRIWSATSGQELHGYYSDSQQPLRAVAFSSQGALVAGSDDGSVPLWNDGRLCMQQIQDVFGLHCIDGAAHLQGHTRPVHATAFSPDGALLATGGDDKKLIIWSVQTKTPVLIQDQQDALAALAWSPSGQFLAGATGSRVDIWHVHR